jgi:hypothetical protein
MYNSKMVALFNIKIEIEYKNMHNEIKSILHKILDHIQYTHYLHLESRPLG